MGSQGYTSLSRQYLLEQLASLIVAVPRSHPVRVAIDGISASGKTTLADELVRPIEDRGRPVIRASIDHFHRPRAERYLRGPDSPVGYYLDSFDYRSLFAELVVPLGPGGSRLYRPGVFDRLRDTPINIPPHQSPETAILVLDGVFLFRPELNRYWDFRIFINVKFEEAMKRVCERDLELLDSAEAIRERYQKRYFAGERMYLDEVRPHELANVVVENSSPLTPCILIQDI